MENWWKKNQSLPRIKNEKTLKEEGSPILLPETNNSYIAY